ncbi:MAG: PucR family transcriptional regulator [Mycobacteriales bacterium]
MAEPTAAIPMAVTQGPGRVEAAAAARLAVASHGAVLVCDSSGRLIHHDVDEGCSPDPQVVHAILCRNAAALLTKGWPEPVAGAGAWTSAEADRVVAFARHAGREVSLVVLVAGARLPRLPEVADLLEEIRAAASAEQTGATPAQGALLRLLDGFERPTDAERLGMPIIGARVVIIGTPGPAATQQLAARLEGTRGLISTGHRDGHLIVLVRGLPRQAGEDRDRQLAAQVATQALRVDSALGVGISAPLLDQTQLPDALADAIDAAVIASRDGHSPAWAEVDWAAISRHRLRHALSRCLTSTNPLAKLQAYDATRGGDLARTVGVWLDHNLDTASAGRQLCVHPNTVRYRLRRAGEVVGLDLTDPDQRLVAQLALGR